MQRVSIFLFELLKKSLESICCPSYEMNVGSWQAWVLIGELPRPEGLLGTEPHWHHGKSKKTHEVIFLWLSGLAVLLVATYAPPRRWSRTRWRANVNQNEAK